MTVFDWALVALALVVGGLFTWELYKLLTEKRRQDEEFSRSLALGGQLDKETGLRTGVHATGTPAVDILRREEVTGVFPISARKMASSSE